MTKLVRLYAVQCVKANHLRPSVCRTEQQQQQQWQRCRNNAGTLVPEPKYTLGVHDLNKMRCPPGRK